MFNWRRKKAHSDAKFSFSLDNQDVRIELLDDGKRVPWSQWMTKAPNAAWALAELRALSEDIGINGLNPVLFAEDHVVLLPAAVARIDSNAADMLGLPAPTRLALELKPINRIDEDNFRIGRKWLQPGGHSVMTQQVGAILQSEVGPRRIPEPLWSLYEAAGTLKQPLPKAERFQALAALQLAWPSGADQAIETDGYLRDLRVHYASSMSLKLRTLTPDTTEFDPVLFGASSLNYDDEASLDEEADNILSPSAQRLFASDRFRREASVRPVYVLQGGEYVFIDPSLRPALDIVHKLQDAPESERRQFVLNPRRVLRERLGDEQAEAIGLDRLFVETEQFSARVSGVDIWRAAVLPWLVPSVTSKWLPEKFGLRVGEDFYQIEADALLKLVDRVDSAKAAGEIQILVRDLLTPVEANQPPCPENISLNEQALVAIDALRPFAAAKPDEPGQTSSEAEVSTTPPPHAKLFLVVKDNFEEVAYAADTAPTSTSFDNTPIAPPKLLRSSLKPHQVDGLNWLVSAHRHGLPGVLLADDMGLGKTFQAIAFLAWLQEEAETGRASTAPCLIVAPTGLLGTWKQEIEQHLLAPALGRLVPAFGGSLKQLRDMDSISERDILAGRATLEAEAWRDAGVVLTTYETMRDYHFSFAKTRFNVIIYDEIQKLKNPTSQVTRAAQALNAQFVLGMTGTPVENRLQDLWSIMDVIAPGSLGSSRDFERRHPASDRPALEKLKARLSNAQGTTPPLLLRRMKKDILSGLPTKTIVPFELEMPPVQATAYLDVVVQAAASGSVGTAGRGGMLSTLSKMRGISLHPIDPRQAPADLNAYAKDSARLSCALTLLEKVAALGEKALIFVEDLAMQERLAVLIQARFQLDHLPFRISGAVPGIRRQQIVNDFQGRLDQFDVMILSPKAGGVGLTLTAANHVIHLSRWWNPAVEDQATDRVYRIGQQKNVFVYLPMAVHPDPSIRASSFDLQLNALIDRKRSLSQDLFFPPDGNDNDLNELFRQVALTTGEAKASEDRAADVIIPASSEPLAPHLEPVPTKVNERPVSRPVLSLPAVAKEAGAKVWFKRSGEARPTEEILALFAGKPIHRVTIKDPYCLGSARTRAAQVQFVRLLAESARSLAHVEIHYSADIEGDHDDEHQRRDIASLLNNAFPGSGPKLSLNRRHHRLERHDDFHDRWVEIEVNGAGGVVSKHMLTFGRGLEALFDKQKACTVAYAPPSFA